MKFSITKKNLIVVALGLASYFLSDGIAIVSGYTESVRLSLIFKCVLAIAAFSGFLMTLIAEIFRVFTDK